ncbi:DNA helicase [Achromobacter phage Motura]|uniref:DNA helicase n=1 Tax=Achromobacter phage Motura TaxID=2591403 RepID=A0A514CSG6_9CAUD|nr:DNA helicase [Achromobacter phage Motura]QDH83418.1 DNA helicase [Achromobacter phage Motura]
MSRVKVSSPRVETAVLRGMCHKDLAVSGTLVSSMDTSYFSSEITTEIFEYIREAFHQDGKSPRYKVLLEDPSLSKAARQYLRDSEGSIDSKSDAKKAIKVLSKYRQIREIANLAHYLSDSIQEDKPDMEEMMDKATQMLATARATKSSKDDFVHFGKKSTSKELVNELLFSKKSERVIPSGFQTYDSVSGGFLRGSLFTIGGTSGGGKSQLASSMAVSFCERGFRVVVVPLEMGKSDMLARMMAKVCKFDSGRLLKEDLPLDIAKKLAKKFAKWEAKCAENGGRYTIYKPPGDPYIEDIYAAVAPLKADVRVIDYISLTKERQGVDQWKKLGQDSRYGKIDAEANQCVNIQLCQISEEGKVKYSSAIKEHSSDAWFFVATDETKEQGIIRITQEKSRNGNGFPFTLGISYEHSDVYDLEDWDQNQPRNALGNTEAQEQELKNFSNQADV